MQSKGGNILQLQPQLPGGEEMPKLQPEGKLGNPGQNLMDLEAHSCHKP
jgi:hypothetical protein